MYLGSYRVGCKCAPEVLSSPTDNVNEIEPRTSSKHVKPTFRLEVDSEWILTLETHGISLAIGWKYEMGEVRSRLLVKSFGNERGLKDVVARFVAGARFHRCLTKERRV